MRLILTYAFRAPLYYVIILVPWVPRGRPWVCYVAHSEQSLKGTRSLCTASLRVGTKKKLQTPHSMLPKPSLTALAGLQPPVFKVSKDSLYIYVIRGLPLIMYAPGRGAASLLYISIAYYMQKEGGWVQIALKLRTY